MEEEEKGGPFLFPYISPFFFLLLNLVVLWQGGVGDEPPPKLTPLPNYSSSTMRTTTTTTTSTTIWCPLQYQDMCYPTYANSLPLYLFPFLSFSSSLNTTEITTTIDHFRPPKNKSLTLFTVGFPLLYAHYCHLYFDGCNICECPPPPVKHSPSSSSSFSSLSTTTSTYSPFLSPPFPHHSHMISTTGLCSIISHYSSRNKCTTKHPPCCLQPHLTN